jgi:hypothetical protein
MYSLLTNDPAPVSRPPVGSMVHALMIEAARLFCYEVDGCDEDNVQIDVDLNSEVVLVSDGKEQRSYDFEYLKS